MNTYSAIHNGIIVSFDGSTARVAIDLGDEAQSCGGCALSQVCRKEKKKDDVNKNSDSITVDANVAAGLEIESGKHVTVAAYPGSTLNATIKLLLIPLAAFLAVAVGGTYIGWQDGTVGLSAILAAGLCYLLLWLQGRTNRKRPQWVVTSVLE